MASQELSKQASNIERQEDVALDLPAHTKKDLAAVDSALSTSIHLWLRRRKKNVRPKLSADQQHQLKECFELMDQDGSGAIDADELGSAFKLLGIGLRKVEIEQILDEVGMNADGEVEYPQFLEIMTVTLQRLAEEQAEDKSRSSQVPFPLMATAYRRKRLMEGIISGDKETMGQIVQLSEKQAQEAAMRDAANAAAAARKAENDNRCDTKERQRKMLSSMAKCSMARLARMHVDEGLLMQLGPEERRLLHQVATQAHRQQHFQPPQAAAAQLRQLQPPLSPAMHSPTLSAAGSLRRQSPQNTHRSSLMLSTYAGTTLSPPGTARLASTLGIAELGHRAATADNSFPRLSSISRGHPLRSSAAHFSQLPKYQQLVGVPQCFDIKFSRPTVNVSGAMTGRPQSVGLPFPSATRPLREQAITGPF